MAGESENKKRIPIMEDNGNTWNLHASASNDDWMRAGRLAVRAKAGDEEAKKELEKLDSTRMIYDDDDTEEPRIDET